MFTVNNLKLIFLISFSFVSLTMSSLSFSETIDSTKVIALNSTPKIQKYQSYVDTNNCITTPKKIFVVVGGIGGGKLDQSCPPDHPVMTRWNQLMIYTTAVPWTGAVMGAGGNSDVVCCAVAYRWSEAA